MVGELDPIAARRQEYVGKEVRELERGITHLRNNMARYNALTAENLALKHQLREDNRNLEFNISIELKVGRCAFLPGQKGRLTTVCGPGRSGGPRSCCAVRPLHGQRCCMQSEFVATP